MRTAKFGEFCRFPIDGFTLHSPLPTLIMSTLVSWVTVEDVLQQQAKIASVSADLLEKLGPRVADPQHRSSTELWAAYRELEEKHATLVKAFGGRQFDELAETARMFRARLSTVETYLSILRRGLSARPLEVEAQAAWASYTAASNMADCRSIVEAAGEARIRAQTDPSAREAAALEDAWPGRLGQLREAVRVLEAAMPEKEAITRAAERECLGATELRE